MLECDEITSTQQSAQDSSPGSVSSNPSLLSGGLVEGSSDACSLDSSEVGTDQLQVDEEKVSPPSPPPMATQSSLDKVCTTAPATSYANVCLALFTYRPKLHSYMNQQSLPLVSLA